MLGTLVVKTLLACSAAPPAPAEYPPVEARNHVLDGGTELPTVPRDGDSTRQDAGGDLTPVSGDGDN